jgi:hypothetical protein
MASRCLADWGADAWRAAAWLATPALANLKLHRTMEVGDFKALNFKRYAMLQNNGKLPKPFKLCSLMQILKCLNLSVKHKSTRAASRFATRAASR